MKDLNSHKERVHEKCAACKQIFIDLQQLKNHEPNCSHMKNEIEVSDDPAGIKKNMASLKIDNSELENNFSQILIKMLQKSDCNENEKMLGANIIQKFAS